jgi:hypothetical protein
MLLEFPKAQRNGVFKFVHDYFAREFFEPIMALNTDT